MKRWVFNISVGFSLLLMVAMAGLWVRGYWRKDVLEYSKYSGWSLQTGSPDDNWLWEIVDYVLVFSDRGTLKFYWITKRIGTPGNSYDKSALGFGISKGGGQSTWRSTEGSTTLYFIPNCLTIPKWFFCLLFSLLPAYWVRRRRRHPPQAGLCKRCGYDLRASNERCPECGTVIPADVTRKPITIIEG